jgi:serine/threonine-protein kinase
MSKEDLDFLAILVHRGHVERAQADRLLVGLKNGGDLDSLLASELGWSEAQVAKLRRTRGGEMPEIPGFEVHGKAGSGGTSDVFRVLEKKTKRLLAMKVLKPAATRNATTRKAFIAEARLLERLRHKGLVKGYGVARSGTTYFALMEFVEGSTLLELLDRGHKFDEHTALRIVLEVAEILQHLAAEDVVHRDIKPGNIMLSTGGVVKLIDLGFAACQEDGRSPEDSAVGTVHYLSPEQACGGAAADPRSDIYSLGVTLFHLVAGHLPFESSDDREVLRMQVMESLSSPELKGRGLSHHLHYFVEKMMAKDATARYQSWGELIEDIRSQLVGREAMDFEKEARARSAKLGGTATSRRRPQ